MKPGRTRESAVDWIWVGCECGEGTGCLFIKSVCLPGLSGVRFVNGSSCSCFMGQTGTQVLLERCPSLAACPMCPVWGQALGTATQPLWSRGHSCTRGRSVAPVWLAPLRVWCVEGRSVQARPLVPWGPGSPRGESSCSRGGQSVSRQQHGVSAGLCSGAPGRGWAMRGNHGLCRSPSCRPSPITGIRLLGPHVSQTATSFCLFLTGPVSWEPAALPPPGACGLAELRAAG